MYLTILFHLLNAKYYPKMYNITAECLQKIVTNIFVYALLESASLVYVHVFFKRKLRISTLHQLGFILEGNFVYFQGLLIGWVIVVLQLTLAHLRTLVNSFFCLWCRNRFHTSLRLDPRARRVCNNMICTTLGGCVVAV